MMRFQRLTGLWCLLWTPVVCGWLLNEGNIQAPFGELEPPVVDDIDKLEHEAAAAFEYQEILLTIGEMKMMKFFVSGSIKECVNFTFNYHPPNPTFQPFAPLMLCPGNFSQSSPKSKHHINKEEEQVTSGLANFRMSADVGGGRGPLLNALLASTSTSRDAGNSSGGYLPEKTGKHNEEVTYFFNTTMTIVSERNGKTVVTTKASPPIVDVNKRSFVRVAVMASPALSVVADICGWIYTCAWSISFLPQIFLNWKRKSVVGYCLDTVTFETVGFSCYSIFNLGLLLSPLIKAQFADRHPTGVNHVRLNDAIFPVYSLCCDIIIIIQCCIYKTDEKQRVSTTCRSIVGVVALSLVIGISLALADVVWWLDVLYWASYVKLFISTVGYIPQVNENYKRKSTEGFSVQSIYLDIMGGAFSLLQMFLLAANYDEWVSVLTDPTKLGLGVLTLCFDGVLLFQHHILYRAEKK